MNRITLGWLCGMLLTATACHDTHETPAPSAATMPASAPVPTAAPAPQAAPRFHIVENVQTPTATTPDGCTSLELDRKWHTLFYRRGASPSCPHFEQSLELLHEMLLAFTSMDDLSTVTSLGFGGRDYTSFFQRLAIASASSPDWDARHGRPKQDHDGADTSNAFVVSVAHEPAKFFPEVVSLLRDTKLRPELRAVEKVTIGSAAQTPFPEALAAAHVDPSAKLPYDCMLGFHLVAE